MLPKFTKTSQKFFKRSLSTRSAFALSIFGSWYSDAVLGTVRLIANKIKGCKSLRLFNHLPIVHPNVYQPCHKYIVHQQTWFEDDG